MAARARLGGVHRYNTKKGTQPYIATASVSVGGDDWANQVINNVVGEGGEDHHDNLEQERELAVEKKIGEKKRLFHTGRLLELKNLPDGATEQDIRLSFPDLDILRVQIDRDDVRHRPGAKLTLKNPEVLENWPKSRETCFVKNKEVSVCVGSSDQWLCIARLPLEFSEDEFTSLVSNYGRVKASFLVCSETTGESKGYGLVKYQTNEAAAQAKHLLNGKDVQCSTVQVDWLNSTHISYTQLHSKCLYVDNLPPNYRDLAGYRKMFSVVRNPPYCQIAMRNGVLQDWGLVEFFDADEAEITQTQLHGHNINGHKIRVQYCIPGVNAINIYMSVVNAPETSKKGLIDEAPNSAVYTQLQKLSTQNPAFAQNLQNIIQQQIENIQSGGSGSREEQEQESAVNASAQAALMILLTAHQQAQTGENCILQNQEVVNVLQTLVCEKEGLQLDPYAEIMSIPSLQVALGQGHPELSWNLQPEPNYIQVQGRSPPPVIANNLNLLSNTQTLNELLGSLREQDLAPPPPPPPPPISSPNISVPPPSQPPHVSIPHNDFSCPPPFTPVQPPLSRPLHFFTPPPPLPSPHHLMGPPQPMFINPNMFQFPSLMLPGVQVTGPPPAPIFLAGHQLIPQVSLPNGNTLFPGLPLLPGCYIPVSEPSSPVPSNISSGFPHTPSPNSLKRKASIPPSPEESPEGRYIGQHSQGLGGHYADSYWAKKRIKHH